MLSTTLGNRNMRICIYNASGVKCKSHMELYELYRDSCDTGAVVSKSTTLLERNGNPEPIYYEDTHVGMSINSSGLPNRGYQYYIDFARTLKTNASNLYLQKKPYFVSISGMSLVDNIRMAKYTKTDTEFLDGIELNLSCPNIIGKPQIGYDFVAMEEMIRKVREEISNEILFGLKLPPYFDISHYESACAIINEFKVDTLTCINSLGNGLMVNPYNESVVIRPKNGYGGIGGSVIKSIALANVHYFYKHTKSDIIGCGGITKGLDAFEHILCGAKAVQLGTIVMIEGLDAFTRIKKELIAVMKEKKYTSIEDFRGKLKYFD
jgi:dihydroorotate dehydrogenase (fumarate)